MKFILSVITLAGALMLPIDVVAQNSVLRIACDGDDVGAEVSINGKFRGECPVDIQVAPGTIKLRAQKAGREQVQEFRVGPDSVKKIVVAIPRNAGTPRTLAPGANEAPAKAPAEIAQDRIDRERLVQEERDRSNQEIGRRRMEDHLRQQADEKVRQEASQERENRKWLAECARDRARYERESRNGNNARPPEMGC